MQVTEFYQKILGLESPWQIEKVELIDSGKKVNIQLSHPEKSKFPCKHCGIKCSVYDHNKQRVWRHLDTCDYYTYLTATLPRVTCEICGIHTISPSWSRPNSKFTLLFECHAIDVLQQSQVLSRSALQLRISVDQLKYIQQQAVQRGLNRRKDYSTYVVTHICIDEKSLHKGHHYVSVLYNGTTGAVIEVVEHRTQVAATQGFTNLGQYVDLEKIEVITLDMWAAFKNAAKAVVSHADLVHDRYHIAQYLNKAVDQTRRAENKKLLKQEVPDDCLKGTRYLWLKTPSNWTEAQQNQHQELLKNKDLKTAQVWQLKEDFKGFFKAADEAEATKFFNNWVDRVEQLENKQLISVAKTFKNHWKGLITYYKHKVSNAMAECINSAIQQLKMKARGFKSAKAFRCAILFHCGQLDLYP